MKRTALLWLVFLTGCSSAPVVDFMDWAKPAHMPTGSVATYGGVCGHECAPSAPPVTSFSSPLVQVDQPPTPLVLPGTAVTQVPAPPVETVPGKPAVSEAPAPGVAPATPTWRRQ